MSIKKEIVLASASPRRKELLERIGLPFIAHSTDFEEKDELETPQELVIHNSHGKAQKLLRTYPDALLIGVDTVGVHMGRILNKPKDTEDAKEILRFLSNSTHEVISGITIINSRTQKCLSAIETTKVTIDRLSEEDIQAYIDSEEGTDKAAGYAIQGLGSLFVKRIEGDYFNVVGLPIYLLRQMLKEFGVNRWWKD